MSQAWIKIETITPDKIEVARIATALGMDRYAVLGRLIRVWSYWDQHSTTGRIDGIDAAFLDGLVGNPGFSVQIVAVGWMKIDAESITLPHFDRHNGATAKARALTARRMEKHRGGKRNKSYARGDAESVTAASPEERRGEKRREEQNTPQGGGDGQGDLPFSETPPSERFDDATALAQEFAFQGKEATSLPAIQRAKAAIEDIMAAGITPDAIRAEIHRAGRLKSEHPGRMRDRLIPKESKNGRQSRPDPADYDPERGDYPRPSPSNNPDRPGDDPRTESA